MKRSKRLHIDLEVYSESNLKDTGVARQIEDLTTEVIFFAYKIEQQPTKIWCPIFGEEAPEELLATLDDESFDLVAHNAAYEKLMLSSHVGSKLGLKKRWFPWKRWVCTMAKALMMGVPGSLEKCAEALALEHKKDTKGKRSMLKITKPDKHGKRILPDDAPEDYERCRVYCLQDVDVEAEVDHYLPDLTNHERFKVWVMDKEINERGVFVDVPTIKRIFEFAGHYKEDLTEEFISLCGLKPTQNLKLKDYFAERGLVLPNMTKDVVLAALPDVEDLEIKRLLTIRLNLSKASTSKYTKILQMVCSDDRIKNVLTYHGAGTGRWAAVGVQVQNLTKETKLLQQDQIIRMVNSSTYEQFRMMFPDTYDAFKSCLRGVFCAKPRHRLAVSDLCQIEARVIKWLADDDKGLEDFAAGKDVYVLAACGIYEILEGKSFLEEEIQPHQRTIGKVAELALGFAGGKGAFLNMAKIYGVIISEEDAESIKVAWRKSNSKITQMWREVEEAAIMATEGRRVHRAAHCKFQRVRQDSGLDCLVVELPSGRRLFYYKPETYMSTFTYTNKDKEVKEITKKALRYWGVKSEGTGAKKYRLIDTHGGKLVENLVQAIARDVLAFHMLILKDGEGDIVLHVHDEVVIETQEHNALSVDKFCDTMSIVPEWLPGIPLAADGFCSRRYNK